MVARAGLARGSCLVTVFRRPRPLPLSEVPPWIQYGYRRLESSGREAKPEEAKQDEAKQDAAKSTDPPPFRLQMYKSTYERVQREREQETDFARRRLRSVGRTRALWNTIG